MFRVTRAEEQAVRLTMRLATAGGQVTLASLAGAEQLPEPTVAKLLGMLRRGGVVDAVRGRHGGYVLADTPESITAGSVIRSISGCGLRPVWQHLGDRVSEVLEQTTVADLLKREAASTRDLQELWPLNES